MIDDTPEDRMVVRLVSLSTVFDVAIRESRSRYSMFRDLFSSANVSTQKNISAEIKWAQPSCAHAIWWAAENGMICAATKVADSRYLMLTKSS
jgi:hypothetical protein